MPAKWVLSVFCFYFLCLEGLIAQPVDIGNDNRAKAQLDLAYSQWTPLHVNH